MEPRWWQQRWLEGDPRGSGRGERTDSTGSGTRLFYLEGKKRCRNGSACEWAWVWEGVGWGVKTGILLSGSPGEGAEVGKRAPRASRVSAPQPAPLRLGMDRLFPNLDFHFCCLETDFLEIEFCFSQQTRPSRFQLAQVSLGPAGDARPPGRSRRPFQPPSPNPLSQSPPSPARPPLPPYRAELGEARTAGLRGFRSQSPPVGTVFLSTALK